MKPHEEWVDGSWTVDCVCGVRFDDGKEMVNCDECGVWVHTWCSRYVKGDDLFACHKCKIKSNKLRMESLSSQGRTFTVNREFRACIEIPIEERVHVQGVPGGDLALFEGFSSVFSRQLWKCTGYVPKNFRFKSREFPCWDDQEDSFDDVAGPIDDVVATSDEMLCVQDKRRTFSSRGMGLKRSQSDAVKSLISPLSTDTRRREDCEDRVNKKVKVDDDNDDFGGQNPESAIGGL